MYCDGYKGRLRTIRIALVATGVGCMRTTWLKNYQSAVMETRVG